MGSMTPAIPADLLAGAVASASAQPFLTFYDDRSGERVELSVATLDNWVAKTANLLQDGLNTEPGERLTIALPTHWQAAVWTLAAWAAGLVVDLDQAEGPDVAVSGPDTLDAVLTWKARDTVALALRPLGGPFTEELPTGVWDYGGEVLAYGDDFEPYVPTAGDDPALLRDGVTMSGAELVSVTAARVEELGLRRGERILTDLNPSTHPGLIDALLAPLAVLGSAVLVVNPDRRQLEDRMRSERVTRSWVGPTSPKSPGSIGE
jgi:uncharacterized protein (TIGR03089 family)